MASRPTDPREGARTAYAPSPPVSTPCRYCDGKRNAARGARCCFECTSAAQAMVLLGHAVPAFIHRAAVAELVEDVLDGIHAHADAPTRRYARAALTELAALALAGGSEGG